MHIIIVVVSWFFIFFAFTAGLSPNNFLVKECVRGSIYGWDYVYEVSIFNTKTITYYYGAEVERDKQEDKKKELARIFELEEEKCSFHFPKKSGSDAFLNKQFIRPITITSW